MGHSVINGCMIGDEFNSQFFSPDRLSMADIVKVKDVRKMLNFRDTLRNKLTL